MTTNIKGYQSISPFELARLAIKHQQFSNAVKRCYQAYQLQPPKRVLILGFFQKIVTNETLPASVRAMALKKLGNCHAISKHWEEAIGKFEAALDIPNISDELKAQLHFCLGKVSLKNKDYEKAIEMFSSTIENNSSTKKLEAKALYYIGNSFFLKNQKTLALSSYQYCVKNINHLPKSLHSSLDLMLTLIEEPLGNDEHASMEKLPCSKQLFHHKLISLRKSRSLRNSA